MNSTIDLDDKIRDMLAQLDRAMPPPPPFGVLNGIVQPGATRLVPLVGAAAIVVLGVGGLVAVSNRENVSTAPETAMSDVIIEDAHAISLDEWADPADSVEPCPCVVLDLAHLPNSWTGIPMIAGYNLAAGGYQSRVALSHPDLPGLTVEIRSSPIDLPTAEDGSVVTIGDDTDARLTTSGLVWQIDAGLQATIDIGDGDADVAVDLARNLPLTTIDHLPATELPDPLAPARDPADAELSGTINGHRWQLDVGPASSINLNLAVDGVGVSAMARDGDDPAPGNSMDISIGAIGDGIVLYGRTPPSAIGLRVEVANQPDIDVPVRRRATDTVFGVPVPKGLNITGLAFTDDNGNVIHRVLIPALPTPMLSMGLPEQTFNNPNGQPLI